MKHVDQNTQIFIELLEAGLWENKVQLTTNEEIDYSEILRLAREQSVVGLVAAGLEHAEGVPYETKLTFIGLASQIQQRNEAMNRFIAELVQKMQSAGINSLLVKGQGVAQCYERPLWRTCGDVDFFFDKYNYERAKIFLTSQALCVGGESHQALHYELLFDSWLVELHGDLHSISLPSMDRVIDSVLEESVHDKQVRIWNNNHTEIVIPNPDNDVLIIFAHIIKHFFHKGVGLRQICDWCRLLWTFRDVIDVSLLEHRLQQMRLSTEWKAFAAFAVDYLGMSIEAMPFYSSERRWKRKAKRISSYVLEMGNFGQNIKPQNKNLAQKLNQLKRYSYDSFRQFPIFPVDSLKVWIWVIRSGISTINNR